MILYTRCMVSTTIQPLPSDVVHLIAAGEVIDSLAAVVRELIENALDADATRITISLWAEQWRVQVSDNGVGMSLEDLSQAASAHSTSKITASQDLWNLRSLGFRGEALHSLAQLADLTICSRSDATEHGWQVTYNNQGQPISQASVAIAPGTVVTVENLFGNWLSRRQGLPSAAQQLRAVQLMIHQFALCHPQVTWQVEQNDRSWFGIWASETPQQILPQLLRDVRPEDLQFVQRDLDFAESTTGQSLRVGEDAIAIEFPNSAQSLQVVLGLPDRCHRSRPDWIKIAINGRMVNLPALEQTIQAAMHRTLPRDRHPVCFVHLRVHPHHVDWNRHPAKTEVYLQYLDQWRSLITEAIHQALTLNPGSLPDATYSQRIGQVIKAAEAQSRYGSRFSSPEPALVSLKAIAQVHQMYILAEHPDGVWLVEQHIAHERVLYEHLCDRWQLVPLEPPLTLPNLSDAQVDQLQRIGVDIDLFGDRLWAIRSAPEPLVSREDCSDALLELSLGGNLDTAIVATACRTAIRNGTPLSLNEMQTLLNQWQRTRQPQTCPHGRPIYLSLAESSLSRFFRRHWVIGKSHGI